MDRANPRATVTVRRATAGDLPAVRVLLSACELPTQDLQQAHQLTNFNVAVRGHELIGVVGLEVFENEALLRSLAVKRDARGANLGLTLLNTAHACALDAGVQSLYLLTTTAAVFFQDAGYRPCEREQVPAAIAGTREFADLCPASAVCMTRELVR